jgi:ribonuclease BN (tRNA processing enzyme)
MNVTILGAGTAIPQPRRSPSGLLIRLRRASWLLDAGPGTLQRAQAAGVSPYDLDRVFLTHFHLDHCLDLASLLFARRIPSQGRQQPLTVYGPRGLATLYRRLNAAFQGWLAPRQYHLTLRELGETTLRLDGATVRSRWMSHSTPTLGYRVEAEGRCVAYSGDTDVCDAIVELGRVADALILECSMPDERKVAGHLTPSECGRIAAAAKCRRLVLTHFYPVFDPSTRAPALAGDPSLGMLPTRSRGVVLSERSESKGVRYGAPGLPMGLHIRARVRRAFRGPLTLACDGMAIALPPA